MRQALFVLTLLAQHAHQRCGSRAGQDSSAFDGMSDVAHATLAVGRIPYGLV